MNDFNKTQCERLAVEGKLEWWAVRYNEIESERLKQEVLPKVKEIIRQYESQIPAMEYHIQRFNELRMYYESK